MALTPFLKRALFGVFLLGWLVGLIFWLSVPVVHIAIRGVDSRDPYGSLIVSFNENSIYTHPHFTGPAKKALLDLLKSVRPDETLVLVGVIDPESSQDSLIFDYIFGYSYTWIFPLRWTDRCILSPTRPDISRCHIPDGAAVVGYHITPSDDMVCSRGDMGLLLCR